MNDNCKYKNVSNYIHVHVASVHIMYCNSVGTCVLWQMLEWSSKVEIKFEKTTLNVKAVWKLW